MVREREQRRSVRVSHPVAARYYPFRDVALGWRSMQLVNLSVGGARFLNSERMETGDELELDVPMRGTISPMRVRGRVVWHRMPAAGMAEHGVEFLDLTLEQLVQIEEIAQSPRSSHA